MEQGTVDWILMVVYQKLVLLTIKYQSHKSKAKTMHQTTSPSSLRALDKRRICKMHQLDKE